MRSHELKPSCCWDKHDASVKAGMRMHLQQGASSLACSGPSQVVHNQAVALTVRDSVTAGAHTRLTQTACAGTWEIAEARLAYGGVAAKALMARKAQAAMEGQPLNQDTLSAALKAVAEDVVITASAPGVCCMHCLPSWHTKQVNAVQGYPSESSEFCSQVWSCKCRSAACPLLSPSA